MIKSIGILMLVSIASLFCACSTEEIPTPAMSTCGTDYTGHPQHASYMDALKEYTAHSSAPGSVIGVKTNGLPEWIGAQGISNLEYATPMEVCTPFRTGSVTKMFTAVIIMQLNGADQLALTTTVAEILPEVKGNIPDAERMTVEQLLNHTSGLRQPTDDDVSYQLSVINNPDYFGSLDAH